MNAARYTRNILYIRNTRCAAVCMKIVGILLISLFIMSGCNSSELNMQDYPYDENDGVDVPISISIGSGWSVGLGDSEQTRDRATRGEMYDSDELVGVTEAQIYVFRRKIGSDEGEPFRYDPTNFMIIPLKVSEDDNDVIPLNGSGYLHKRPGYEYRIMAISYASERISSYHNIYYSVSKSFGLRDAVSDLERFNVLIEPEMSFEDFKLRIRRYEIKFESGSWTDYLDGKNSDFVGVIDESLANTGVLSGYVAEMPHLFYCECYTDYEGKVSHIIPYSEEVRDGEATTNAEISTETEAHSEKKDIPIKGTLSVGMAKVVVRIENVSRHNTRFGAGNVHWIALMSDNVSEENYVLDLGNKILNDGDVLTEKFTSVSYAKIATDGDNLELSTYLWPGLTHLGVRVRCDINVNYGVIYMGNYKLCPKDNVSIDKETGAEIINTRDSLFYLRPNHKYVITVKDSEDLFKEEMK